jgi:hypothetical protein
VPYRLFVLSNAGSLLALVMYPTVVEPGLTLVSQRALWAGGFAMYAGLCGWLVWGDGSSGGAEPHVSEELRAIPHALLHPTAMKLRRGWGIRWLWFLLPMGAAMQLSAVTSHLSQDIAAIPLLWVLPLGVYLLTFILAFEAPRLYRRWLLVRLMVVMLASLGYLLSKVDMDVPIGYAILFFLIELFVACWFCHAEVYALRPAGVAESTAFYLLVAAGGVAGTFLVGIASPLIFRANYDLALSFVATAMLALAVTWRDGWGPRLLWSAASVLLMVLVGMLHVALARNTLLEARNFYGALRVKVSDGPIDAGGSGSVGTGPLRTLLSGTIQHGTQMMEAERRRVPTTYYAEDSGIGLALRNCCPGRPRRVGVVGLGAGTLAAYGEAGDRMRFYEINPLVEPIARNLFTYLRDSPAEISVANGDARASLQLEAPQGFDVLVVDAFSGDAIPLHLLTREAMGVYRRQLAPGGIIAFHISNRFLNLAPAVGKLASAEGMQALRIESQPVDDRGEYLATWVLVSDNARFFQQQEIADAGTPIEDAAGMRGWTDNYSSLLPVLKWR